ncbi:MAG: thioredoxin [Oscillospiraceae bacterium]|nr:thioredoxin [Oscillospiraceae bacterium]
MLNTVLNNDFAAAKAAPVALVDFNATWCGPCKMLAPLIDKLADEYDGKVEFFSVDTDENDEIAAEYGIVSIPTLVILKNGEEVARDTGFKPEPVLRAFIDANT